MSDDTIKLAHGSGGTLTRRFLDEQVLKHFTSPVLSALPDSASIVVHGGPIAFTTDSYVVDPIFFPGGDIGTLAVNGTVNDLAVAGAIPKFLSCALILEEGFAREDLELILASMQDAATEAGVDIVTGDTKVVPRGKADKVFINTAGIGVRPRDGREPDAEMRPGDVVIVSGTLGDHGAAVLSKREGLGLGESAVLSDCAPLTAVAQAVLANAERVSFLRDVTRGGAATILNEAVEDGPFGIVLTESAVPIRPEVRAICELIGIDPLYLACEGRVAAVVEPESADAVIGALAGTRHAEDACRVGTISNEYAGRLVAETDFGTHRLISPLSGEPLPRIC